MAAIDPVTRKRVLRVIISWICVSLQISFTFILPLFPKLLEFYRDREVPASVGDGPPTLLRQILGGLNRYKAAFSRRIDLRHDIVLLGGAMGSLFSLLQAMASPIIGRFSDRYGRRTALLASICGNIVSVLLWVVAVDFRTFIASRVVGGLSEGNVQLATAIASDICDDASRSPTMAIIGACFCVAFTFGPALGAWLSTMSAVAADPFAVAAGFSLFLIVVETAYLYFYLPETLPALAEANATKGNGNNTASEAKKRAAQSSAVTEKTNSPALLYVVNFFLLFFSGMENSLSFMNYELFSFSSGKNGRLLGFIGLVASVLQGGVTRKMAPLSSIRVGIVSCLTAFILLGRIDTVGGLYAAATCLATTSATVMTGLNALNSFDASEDERSSKLGILRSWGQLVRGLGPVLFTSVYWWAGREYVYRLGATGIAVVTAAVMMGLKTPKAARAAKVNVKGR